MSTDMKEVWKLVTDEIKKDMPQSGEKTVAEFMVEINQELENDGFPTLSLSQVKTLLEHKVKAGEFTSRMIKRKWYFRPVI